MKILTSKNRLDIIRQYLSFLICFLIYIYHAQIKADTEWEYVSPNPCPLYRYQKIYFINQNTGWILMERNFIYFTADKGESWEIQTPAKACMLFDIFFVDDTTGWMTGDWDCTIMHTANQGRKWTLQHKGVDGVLKDIFFIDHHSGWAVGENNNQAVLLKTSNGGQNWEAVNLNLEKGLIKVFFINSLVGWAVGESGLIVHSTDGGSSWHTQESGSTADLLDVCFFNSEQGMIIGRDGYLLITENGGNNWNKAKHSGLNYCAGQILGPNKAVLTGENLSITDDGGKTWLTFHYSTSIPEYIYTYDLYFINNDCWMVGSHGTILFSDDYGQTWTLQSHITLDHLFCVSMPDTNICWVGGESLLITDNIGITWSAPDIEEPFYVSDIYFTSSDTGWVVAFPFLYYTENGGNSWQPLKNMSLQLADPSPSKIFFINSRIGWGINSNYKNIIKTIDGGRTWQAPVDVVATTEDISIKSMFFIDKLHGWCTGVNGLVMKTVDGGNTWVQKSSSTDERIDDIFFIDSLNGWAVGTYNTIIKTDDSGETWLPIDNNLFGDLSKIEFISPLEGWITGRFKVYHTMDGGNIWEEELDSSEEIYDMELFDKNHGWIVGAWGLILKLRHDSQSTFIYNPEKSSLPESHRILRSAPNPFNASTGIHLSLDRPGPARLSILNIQGQRICVLFDERKSAGAYYYQWNGLDKSGHQVPSGIYLLNLETKYDQEIIKIQLLR
jgi:photosystem II stability/assembly factor-like uncharacterized protein